MGEFGSEGSEWENPWGDPPPSEPIIFGTDTPITNEGYGDDDTQTSSDATGERPAVAYNPGDILPEEEPPGPEKFVEPVEPVELVEPVIPLPAGAADAAVDVPPIANDRDEPPIKPPEDMPPAAADSSGEDSGDREDHPSDAPQPFGVEHFYEEVEPAETYELAVAHNQFIRALFEEHADYVDVHRHASGRLRHRVLLENEVPGGEVTVEAASLQKQPDTPPFSPLDSLSLKLTFVPVSGKVSQHVYSRIGRDGTLRRRDLNVDAHKQQTTETKTLSGDALEEKYKEIWRRNKETYKREGDMGINDFMVGPRQFEYMKAVASSAGVRVVAADDLYKLAQHQAPRKGSDPTNWEAAQQAVPDFTRYVHTYMRRRGRDPDSPQAASLKEYVTNAASNSVMQVQVGEERNALGVKSPFVELRFSFDPPPLLRRYMQEADKPMDAGAQVVARIRYMVAGNAFAVNLQNNLVGQHGNILQPLRSGMSPGDTQLAQLVRNFLRTLIIVRH
ncbi:MAG TPA: hypothetical protein VGO07_01760 [Candidatus Saccharimonadales bacterium]|jgi:hypothetical protein|nr:hypothetical protein [Candidatus Saccharimonadales bacterium]